MSGPERCGVTGKLMFASKELARAAVAGYARGKGTGKITDRCIFCGHFHLTKGVRGRPGKK